MKTRKKFWRFWGIIGHNRAKKNVLESIGKGVKYGKSNS